MKSILLCGIIVVGGAGFSYTEKDLQDAVAVWNGAVSAIGSAANGYCSTLPPLLPMFEYTKEEMTPENFALFLTRLQATADAYEAVSSTLSAIVSAGQSIDAIRSALNAGGGAEEYVVYAAGTGFLLQIPGWTEDDSSSFLSLSGNEPTAVSGERDLPLLAVGRRSLGNTEPQFLAFGWGDFLARIYDL